MVFVLVSMTLQILDRGLGVQKELVRTYSIHARAILGHADRSSGNPKSPLNHDDGGPSVSYTPKFLEIPSCWAL